jgi:hypothetical protein
MSDTPQTAHEVPQSHAMSLQRSFPSGAAEWRCAHCGRWTIVAVPRGQERLKIMVLEAGNEHVVHHCSSEGMSISVASVAETENDADAADHSAPSSGRDRNTLH